MKDFFLKDLLTTISQIFFKLINFFFFRKGRGKKRNEIQGHLGGNAGVRGAVLTAEGVQEAHDLGAFSYLSQNALFLPHIFTPALSKMGIQVQKLKPQGFYSIAVFFNYF